MDIIPTTRKKINRVAKLSDIKVLTDEAKNLIIKTENDFKNKCCVLDSEKTDILKNGYIGKTQKQHYKSSFLYAIARVLSVIGYAKKPTGINKTLIEDIKRIGYDMDKNQISFNFIDKSNFLK